MKEKSVRRRRITERLFVVLFLAGIGVALLTLAALIGYIAAAGLPYLKPHLLTNPPSVLFPERAGIGVALVSSLWLVGLTMLFSLPLGIGAGIYLEEYGGRSRLARSLQAAVSNLAGVPSVVFGILGLGLFVQAFRMGPILLAGAFTMTLLVFPYVVIATQEALRAVPQSLRDASLAMGATKWQTIRKQVLPAAFPGILTGAILSASRTLGETAPILVIGAVFLQSYVPDGPFSTFTALPIQIFGWATDARPEFRGLAAAAVIVFLGVLIAVNLVAILLRNRYQRRW